MDFGHTRDRPDGRRDGMVMTVDLVTVGSGLAILAGASAAAFWFKKRMDTSGGVEVIGWMIALSLSNILQLIGIGVILVGFFG